MSEPVTPVLAAAYVAEIIFVLAGLFIWWRTAIRPAARTQPPRLAPWSIPPSGFLTLALVVVGGGYFFVLLAQTLAEPYLRKHAASEDARTVLYTAALEFGLLAGAAGMWIYQKTQRPAAGSPPSDSGGLPLPLAGILTFLAVRPATDLSGLVSEQALQFFGLPSKPQEQIEVFMRLQSTPLFIAFFLLAVVIAPVAEELVFRAGLFRYLRTRLPRWAALLLPALFFAMLHLDWKTSGGLSSLVPLTALAVVFSLAYERTGRIGVTMIAHSLFNLTNILFLLAGMHS